MSGDLEIKYKGRQVVMPDFIGYVPRTTFPPGARQCVVDSINITAGEYICWVDFMDGHGNVWVQLDEIYATETEALEASKRCLLNEADQTVTRLEAELQKARQHRDAVSEAARSVSG